MADETPEQRKERLARLRQQQASTPTAGGSDGGSSLPKPKLGNPLVDQPKASGPQSTDFSFFSDPLAAFQSKGNTHTPSQAPSPPVQPPQMRIPAMNLAPAPPPGPPPPNFDGGRSGGRHPGPGGRGPGGYAPYATPPAHRTPQQHFMPRPPGGMTPGGFPTPPPGPPPPQGFNSPSPFHPGGRSGGGRGRGGFNGGGGGRGRGQHHGGDRQQYDHDAEGFYHPSMVQDPWEKLLARLENGGGGNNSNQNHTQPRPPPGPPSNSPFPHRPPGQDDEGRNPWSEEGRMDRPWAS